MKKNPKTSADTEYLDAVHRGDVDRAAEMVRKKALSKGYNLELYHGTTHEFHVFRLGRVNIENDFGRGFYFTSNINDAVNNYQGIGPDLQGRIERLAEILAQDGMTEEQAVEEANRQLVGNVRRLLRVRVRLKNPCIIGGRNETTLDYSYDEDSGEESGSIAKMYEAAKRVSGELYGFDADEFMQEASVEPDEPFRTVIDRVRKGNSLAGAEIDGELAFGEVLRRIIEYMGHDGIVDRTVSSRFNMSGMDKDTYHVIAFHPNQIKLADAVTRDDKGNVIPLSRRYDIESDDIRNPRTRTRRML